MKNFKYFRPKNLDELLAIKNELKEEARLLAGGSNLLVYIKEGSLKSGTLVDIGSLAALKGIREKDGYLEIGAAETIIDIMASPVVSEKLPFLRESLRVFANPLIRNISTVAGNIAEGSPIADTAPLLLVLNSEVVAASITGRRNIPIDDFFISLGKTEIKANEVIITIRIPIPETGRGKFVKLGLRKGTSCSVVSVAVWLIANGRGVEDIRIALGGVAPLPLRAVKTEALFRGKILNEHNIGELALEVTNEITPITDVRGGAAYRSEVSAALLSKAVRECLGMEE
ncbi:MAG TPA: xanthine dehydrogenase family protein subunit M [Spirochaetales bacterium]|nr:xanthine dehydrogenase family protein subunit M [Spirochaetales bacterium]